MKVRLLRCAPYLGQLSGLVVVFLFLWWYSGSNQRHRVTYHRIDQCIDRLLAQRPTAMTPRDWNYLVGWTRNGLGNCCSSPSLIRENVRFEQFATDIERRVMGKVDIQTIDWIWDEFEATSLNGKNYSERWRPTLPSRREDAKSTTVDL